MENFSINANLVLMNFPSNEVITPRIAHQLWFNKEQPNSISRSCMDSVAIGLPGWQVHIWNVDDIMEISHKFICKDIILDQNIGMQIRPNLIRYEILRLFGGAYVDINFQFYRGIEEIIIEDCAHIGVDAEGYCGGALMISPPGHPLWSHLLINFSNKWKNLSSSHLGQRIHLTELSIHSGLFDFMRGDWNCCEMVTTDNQIAGRLYDSRNLVIWTHSAIYLHPESLKFHRKWCKAESENIYGAHLWTGSWMMESF